MANTYTYAARSADDTKRVVTFTLNDRRLMVEPGTAAWVEEMPDSIAAKAGSPSHQAVRGWSEMVSLLKQTGSVSFDLVNVEAAVEKDGLRLMTWAHSQEKRWMPITLAIEHVDNPDAAQAFVKELHRRKMLAMRRENFITWIGYRLKWFGIGALAAFAAVFSRRLQRKN